jgi:hypothetical protein
MSMFKAQSTVGQPLIVTRGSGSTLHLLAHGAAVLDEDELRTPQVQALIAAGMLRVSPLKAMRGERSSRERRPPPDPAPTVRPRREG